MREGCIGGYHGDKVEERSWRADARVLFEDTLGEDGCFAFVETLGAGEDELAGGEEAFLEAGIISG